MGTARRQYPDEFKREALELLVSSGRPLSQIAGELGIPPERLRVWRNRSGGSKAGSPRRPNTQAAIPTAGVDLATENARLRRENERLRMEREISKKHCASSRNHRNEIPYHRGSARDVPDSRLVRRDGRLSGGVLCLARPARKPTQDSQSHPARRDPAPSFGPSRPLWRAENPRGLARPGAHGKPRPHRAPHASSWHKGNNSATVPDMHYGQPSRLAHRSNQVWLADITYVPTSEGWLYLAVVLDLFTRKIVGWAMRDHMRAELTIAALTMAIQRQKPPPGLIHHSDRGSQYAATDYRKVLDGAAMIQSMSRKGNCWDNAPMESCFGTIKTELVHHACYPTREAARHDLFAYIEGYYNRQRLHSALGYITPEQAERQAA